MKKSDKEPFITEGGHFLLKHPNLVFVKAAGRNVKIVERDKVRVGEKVVFCDRCHAVPAVQLDFMYGSNTHDFTLCQFCLDDLENITIGGSK